jgi:hypothetical protein
MGIQINGNTDTITAIDGALTVSGAELAGTSNINVAGIITATGFVGNLTGNVNSSGVSTFAAGSASAPSITPTGDSNTGIFFPAADTIAFAEGGVEGFRLDSSGRLGIGTNNPSTLIHTYGFNNSASIESRVENAGTSDVTIRLKRNNSDIGYFSNGSGSISGANSTDCALTAVNNLLFGTGSVERARVSAGGTFYVGTTSFGVPTRIAASDSFSWFSGIYVGAVPNSVNNNSEFVPIHRLGQGQGSQFSGHLIANSWTGNAYLNLHITSLYTSDAINWTIINASANTATISKTTIQLVTATYNSQTWWGFLKNGGGSGVFYINAFIESNAGVGGNLGLRAVTSGYTVTTTHATLNP